MEPDRFRSNEAYYLVGMVCLVIGLCFIAFSLYLVPFFVFGFYRDVPNFVVDWLSRLENHFLLSHTAAKWVIFLGGFLIGLVFGLIADILSNRIDKQLVQPPPSLQATASPAERANQIAKRESGILIFKIIFIMIFIFIVAAFFQWAISST